MREKEKWQKGDKVKDGELKLKLRSMMEKKKDEGYERMLLIIKNEEDDEDGKKNVDKIGVEEVEDNKIKIKLK